LKISVITVSYNSAKTIERTIQSVLAQDYPYIEYIIVDGASNDGTLDVTAKYGPKISKMISEKDKGIYDAMNKGLALATGDLVHFLNSDDWYASPTVISQIVREVSDLQKMYHGKLRFYHQDGRVTEMGGEVKPLDLRYEIKNLHQPALFCPKSFFDKWGGFDSSYRVSADYDLMRRFLTQAPSAFVDLVVTNMSDGGTSTKMIDAGIRENVAIAIRFGESSFSAWKRAYWVRFWLGIRYRCPKIFWALKRLKGAF
jgi:glycosyltransferase involved in cell wall biosynthesis